MSAGPASSSVPGPAAMICPYCRTEIVAGEETPAFCGGCGTPHHAECYQENGGCTLFGCKCAPPDEPKVQVTNVDVFSAPAWPGGYPQAPPGGYGAPYGTPAYGAPGYAAPWPAPQAYPAPAQTQPTGFGDVASVPRLGASGTLGAVSAPLQGQEVPAANVPVTSNQGMPGSILFASQGTVPQSQAKNRIAFIMLGLFLGFLGLHNSYAGYWKRGMLQSGLTMIPAVIAMFASWVWAIGLSALFITWVWAIVEVCTIDRDSKGVIFS